MPFLNSKESLENFFSEVNKKVEPAIKKFLQESASSSFQELLFYTIETGGKRLRPALTLLACQASGGKESQAISAAAGLEIIHNYSLIVDDIIDHGLVRRNKPTLWAKYGKSIAECVAIDFGVAVFQAAGKSPEPQKITEIFAKTLKAIVEGEVMDILFERFGREDEPYVKQSRPEVIEEKNYLEMIRKKTAVLLSASCEAGAVCSRSKQEYIVALKNFGLNLGLAFQIQDDILDMFGDEKKFGKKIGKDIEERKGGNIVLLLAMEELLLESKQKISAIMAKKRISKKDINQILALIKKTKALASAMGLEKRFVAKAKKFLTILPDTKSRELLSTLADFVVQRDK